MPKLFRRFYDDVCQKETKAKRKNTYLGKFYMMGYTYTTSYFTDNSSKRYLRCSLYSKLGCKARAVQNYDTNKFTLFGSHIHLPLLGKDNEFIFLNELKKAIDLNRPLKSIYYEVAQRFPQSALEKSFENVRPSMSRWRTKLHALIEDDETVQTIRRRPVTPRYIVDGFVFHCNIMKGNPKTMYLRCLEYKRLGCHARAVIPYDGSLQDIKLNKPHNHSPDYAAEEKIIFLRELKEVLEKNPVLSNRDIYQTLAEMYPNAARETPFETIRNKMNRWRREWDKQCILADDSSQ